MATNSNMFVAVLKLLIEIKAKTKNIFKPKKTNRKNLRELKLIKKYKHIAKLQ